MNVLSLAVLVTTLTSVPPLGTPLLTPPALPPSAAPAPAPLAERSPGGGSDAPAGESRVRDRAREVTDDGLPRFGAQVDAGVPDGLGFSGVFRPLRALQLNLGVITHTASAGVRAGVTWVPLPFFVSPSLSLEGGYMGSGDLRELLPASLTPPGIGGQLLSDVSYRFASARVGLEIGSPERFLLYVRGGLSYLDADLAAVQQQLDPKVSLALGQTSLSLLIPSAKVGFVVFF